MSEYTLPNFSKEEETKASKQLMALSAVLLVVFATMGILKVESGMSHWLWFTFAIFSFWGVIVFHFASKADEAKK